MLSDSESDVDNVQQFTVNEHFAKAYARKKEREELSKLKEKYGSDGGEDDEDSEDSEENTSEDEDGEELTPALDAAILRTLARIKRKDPGIYDAEKDVFEEEQQRTKTTRFQFNAQKDKDKSKPLHMRQHVLNSTLKSTSRSPSPVPLTHFEEQETLQKETISAFHTAVSADSAGSDEGDDLLVPREKTKDEIEREQEEYREFLAREVGEDISGLVTLEEGEGARVMEEDENEGTNAIVEESGEGKKKKKKKKGKEEKTREENDHEFLMNYILNRGWIDHSSHHVPTYNEVTRSKNKKDKKPKGVNDNDSSQVDNVGASGSGHGRAGESDSDAAEDFDEEEFDDVVDTFESSYNFRYEEPDAASIPAHPRTIASTVRREENPRKAARERKKERKEEKLLKKREEVKRLKALKMKEIREKLERIGKEGGKSADDEALAQLDLDGDWDPDAHDKQMVGIYGREDAGEFDDEGIDLEKPTWDDDIDIADIIHEEENEAGPSSLNKKKKKDKKKRKGGDDDEDDGVDVDIMDADFEFANTGISSKLSRKGLGAHMDDVYGLEFNDIVGDLPTRFKYTPVLPQAYGLSATEILLADDADLNTVVGLRALAPYRRDKGRTWDAQRNEKLKDFRKTLQNKRGQVAGDVSAGAGKGEGAQEGDGPVKKRKGKKERQKAKLAVTIMDDDLPRTGQEVKDSAENGGDEPPSKKRKRRHKKSSA
ncbi:KRI1-like family C-terminal-domain-containing protein [Phellopilus nigrolimitatus]|nr:KRI1-like family C-terminal-domain-containing protein [Phellopilus nigrolimitatus]